jgi:hypothetical protein
MDGALAFEPIEEEAADAPQDGVSQIAHARLRETVLLWCIGSIFGAGMLALLIGMCVAEISIHRNLAAKSARSSDSSAITLAASR